PTESGKRTHGRIARRSRHPRDAPTQARQGAQLEPRPAAESWIAIWRNRFHILHAVRTNRGAGDGSQPPLVIAATPLVGHCMRNASSVHAVHVRNGCPLEAASGESHEDCPLCGWPGSVEERRPALANTARCRKGTGDALPGLVVPVTTANQRR